MLKEYKGAAVEARLSVGITGTPATFDVDTAVGFPLGATAPFVVCIGRGTNAEEKLLCTRTGGTTTLTVIQRAYDDTSSVDHPAGSIVEHVGDAATLAEANAHANNVPADPHPQYVLIDDLPADLELVAPVVPHTWAVGADVRVPSGDTDYLPPMFVPVPAGWSVTLTRARHRINSGTSATVKLQKNGVDIAGFTGIVVGAAATTDGADATFADGDMLALVVTAVVGTPRNMSFTVYLEYKKLAA